MQEVGRTETYISEGLNTKCSNAILYSNSLQSIPKPCTLKATSGNGFFDNGSLRVVP
jgi:hypothetical protein